MLAEIKVPANRSMLSSPIRTNKLTATQQRHRNAKMAKMGHISNPFVAQGVENTRRLFEKNL